MSVYPSQSITKIFTTRASGGGATNATGTPTGTLYVSGVSNAATVTVANVTTGVYTAQVTLPGSMTQGQVFDLVINATVSGVTDNIPIWSDSYSVPVDANNLPQVDIADVLGHAPTTTTAGILDVNAKNINNATAPTFPASPASTTNITAGTITTVTNLTNAATSGDFTATMKSSLATAVGVAQSGDTYALANGADGFSAIITAVGTPLQSGSYTAPNNADIVSIYNVVTNGTYGNSALLAAIGSPLQSGSYTAPNNADIVSIYNVVTNGTYGNSAIEMMVAQIVAKLPANAIADNTLILAAVGTPMQAGSSVVLSASGMDAVEIESGITPSASLENDAGSQLAAINLRQAIAAMLSAAVGVLANAAGPSPTFKAAGKPSGNTRITGTVDSSGDRSSIALVVPT